MFIWQHPERGPLWEEAGCSRGWGHTVLQTQWEPQLTPVELGAGMTPQSCPELGPAGQGFTHLHGSVSGWGLFWEGLWSQPGGSVPLRPPWRDWSPSTVNRQHSELPGDHPSLQGAPGSVLEHPPWCVNRYARIKDTLSRVLYYLGCIVKKLVNNILRNLISSVGKRVPISQLMSHKFWFVHVKFFGL